jgi:hypothetical protein
VLAVGWWVAIAWPWIIHGLAHVALLVARVSLGRWPHRFGMDDPKGIPAVMVVLGPAGIMMLLWPVSLVGVLVLSLARRGGVWRVLGRLGVGFAVWSAAFVAIRWLDVAQVWVWIMD